MIEIERFHTARGHEVYFAGPSLYEGPLPALFYFSLAGDESLQLHPFNQPVTHLQGAPLRVFSLTLPYHGPGFDKHAAIGYWSKMMAGGESTLLDFVEKSHEAIVDLIDANIVTKVATGGLSRGGFIATHLAAREPRIAAVIGFAPMTDLSYLRDFEEIKAREDIQAQALIHLVDKLTQTPIRFYIGNRDTAVGTDTCFHFVHTLANAAYDARVRSPKIELFINHSIGHRGHGTSAHAFAEGADWIKDHLL